MYDLGFNYILSGEWSKSFNIFAIIGNVCLLSVVHLFSFEVKKEDLIKEVYENAKIVNESAEYIRRDRESEMM